MQDMVSSTCGLMLLWSANPSFTMTTSTDVSWIPMALDLIQDIQSAGGALGVHRGIYWQASALYVPWTIALAGWTCGCYFVSRTTAPGHIGVDAELAQARELEVRYFLLLKDF
ncbi:hypothetical protein EDD36DRAFT_32317 [Exophiala viscosa]|uniref:Uncharacterized protein n=1 Tax=Exophiala viscosa TaxID=2486360 RepID=A0AAN6E753_9EURO|nr:hypothetical protein EDD36DRAFT_32317 [Exophiala viscosa]